MNIKALCFILLLSMMSTLDYQDRGIYYSESDNPCNGKGHDFVRLRINIDGQETVVHEAWGGTTCDEHATSFRKGVTPASGWSDYSKNIVFALRKRPSESMSLESCTRSSRGPRSKTPLSIL